MAIPSWAWTTSGTIRTGTLLRDRYQGRATALAADAHELRPPSGTFSIGQQVFTQTTVFLRADAGRQAAVLRKVPGRVRVTITGAARQRDGLIWWPVSINQGDGIVQGWMAQYDRQTLLDVN